jgi:hypothetical protein
VKKTEEIMEILAAHDLTHSFRDSAALAGCDHHTGARYVRARDAGQLSTTALRLVAHWQFGGLTFMVGGQMCCGVLKEDLIVRIEPTDFDTLVEQPCVRPFDFSGRPMRGKVYVDNGGLADAAVLRTWVQRGTDYVAAHPATAKQRKRG